MSFVTSFPEGQMSLHTDRVSMEDAARQERTAREILRRLESQAGVILADEVGMGKTFVALGVAVSVALARPDSGPVVVMVPSSLKHKWPRDWDVFREHCLRDDRARSLQAHAADSGVDFLRLLDDPPDRRKAIIFLTHGALNRSLTDEWVKLALIQRALARRKIVGNLSAARVRDVLPKFAGRLLRARWVPSDLWERLLQNPPADWRRLLKRAGLDEVAVDDPVPATLVDAMADETIDLGPVLDALGNLPLRESANVEERLRDVREALRVAVANMWAAWLGKTRFRSPLLILDEAHHLKNTTRLSSLFSDEEAQADSQAVSRGPLAGVFARMLFLTATPFQLGHHELINVLRRFEGVDWTSPESPPGGRAGFVVQIETLGQSLDEAQAAALRLEQAWGRLRPGQLETNSTVPADVDGWWQRVQMMEPGQDLEGGSVAEVVQRYRECHAKMRVAEGVLRPWVIRHLKPRLLPQGSEPFAPPRRETLIGASIQDDRPESGDHGLEVDGDALLPFLLAARAQAAVAVNRNGGAPRRAGFAEGLASSYEAYLETHQDDDADDSADATTPDDAEMAWYLSCLTEALPKDGEARGRHPKVIETVDRALRLWWLGEKSLVFCHYRATGRALRRHISLRLKDQILERAGAALSVSDPAEAQTALERLGAQFFDTDGRLRGEATSTLRDLVDPFSELSEGEKQRVVEVALRFLRTPSFLVRYFPLRADDPAAAFREALAREDGSGMGVRRRIDDLCRFLAKRCVAKEREEYLEALLKIQTGAFRRDLPDADDSTDRVEFLPNVRLANGEVEPEARRRLMLAFNAPFFPEILIASSVLAEGVDLHLDCRFVIHHDLCWNPSTIEQRTGRVDRIGAKAERARKPIRVYLPFVTATQDEKMFRVVRDRERWFSVVMGERYRTDEQATDKLAERVPFPESAARALAFDLSVTG